MTESCHLIIDSCCDLPYEMIHRDDVELLEFPFFLSDGEHKDDCYLSISPHEFYEGIRKGEEPSTAQMPIQVFKDSFSRAIETKKPTVYLSFTSGLSGSFDAAVLVRDQLLEEHPDAELYIVDCFHASIPEGLLVFEAMNQQERGLSARELAKWAEEARFFIDTEFMVDDLTSLRRGGRIPRSVAFAGTKLDVKPLLNIAVDGTLALVGIARGRKKGMRQIIEYYKKRRLETEGLRTVIIGDADCPKDAERLKEMLLKEDENLLVLRSAIGPVIGSHVGPDMLALAFWSRDRRENVSTSDKIAKKVQQS
ncbi:MAG: DegV family protein [Eggerthellaceae bacterium]|jgi:DegV family protein with EDD domain